MIDARRESGSGHSLPRLITTFLNDATYTPEMEEMTKRFFVQAHPVARWFAAAAFTLGLAGCAGAGAGAGHALPLGETHWMLVEVRGVPVAPGAGRPPYILFDPKKKRVTGYGGVNSFFGGYETSGGELRMPRLASTRRAGPPELMDLESAFFKALSATASYRIRGDTLELLDSSGGAVARFRAQKVQ